MWKKIGLVLIFIICIAIGSGLILGLRYVLVRRAATSFNHELSTFRFNPPALAVVGQVSHLTGDVEKMPRDSTVSAQLQAADSLLVGESLSTTTATSAATLTLGEVAIATMSGESALAYSSGLPGSLLLVQTQGQISYTNLGTSPLTIRLWHTLITCDQGEVRVRLGYPLKHLATVTATSGTTRVVMIDQTNQTQLVSLTAGQTVRINDQTRVITLVAPAPTKKIVRTR